VEESFDHGTVGFRMMMAVFFFFTVILLLNVLIGKFDPLSQSR
jgi:hypothetical protein